MVFHFLGQCAHYNYFQMLIAESDIECAEFQ
jgi:hypothetical protein